MLDNRGPQLQAVLIFLLILCVTTVGLRCYTMKFIVKRFEVEDWLAVVTLVLYMVFTAFALTAVHYGLGHHLVDVPPENRSVAFMWRHISTWLYILISTLTKFVVGLFLLRICSHIRWMKITIRTMLVAVGLFNIFYFILAILSAQPVDYYWLRYAPNPPATGHINDAGWATYPTFIASLMTVIVDWTLAILPMILLWNARLDRRTKASVCCVLAMGSIASVATIVRLPYAAGLLENPDYLYNFTDLAIWSTSEIGLALSASSLGALRPLLRKLKLLSDSTDGQVPSSYVAAGSNNPYGRSQQGRDVDYGAPSGQGTKTDPHDGFGGSYGSGAAARRLSGEHKVGGAIEWFDMERGRSESAIDLVDLGAAQGRDAQLRR
ncbi:uncharacterized protein DNG_03102 [Cephalotrichum gorgonifer]|uniref:Rhodopsin domain-containing protein n=1 Tax=Cephalotrichum gorgonifer TaxID=2041049 RepID=A0AAE8MWC1_9PEZI|nr:uncharacterized protein DNG_03102 [Cephalotrichum gorgonifer]